MNIGDKLMTSHNMQWHLLPHLLSLSRCKWGSHLHLDRCKWGPVTSGQGKKIFIIEDLRDEVAELAIVAELARGLSQLVLWKVTF